MLICPICAKPLQPESGRMRCESGHCFDVAREGYVNLLRSSRSGDRIGDDKLSARSRRDFLNKGYYAPLKDALVHLFSGETGNLLDICCGEGYYTAAVAAETAMQVYGFDISKEMVRLAAKRGKATFFVANMASIPVADESFDFCTHLFAPFNEREFSRVLKPGGKLYSVIPGKYHLWGLKQAVYDTPYHNDEKLPDTQTLVLTDTKRIRASIRLETREDIEAVFRMTPYYFHTSQADKEKLAKLDALDTDIEFIIGQYTKPREDTIWQL